MVRDEEDTGSIPAGGTLAPQAYFLTDEKVCKESPMNFRMFLGLFRRPKEEADWTAVNPTFPPLPPWESPRRCRRLGACTKGPLV